MTRMLTVEAALDKALAEALQGDTAFARWFLKQTRFADEEACCVEVRADNPWSRVKFCIPIGDEGAVEEVVRDAETDVLAIYLTTDGRRLALHIENKLEGGAFTPHQPEAYRARLEQWRERPRLGMYVEATSVLLAPQAFLSKNADEAQFFDARISHEAVARHVSAFAGGGAA